MAKGKLIAVLIASIVLISGCGTQNAATSAELPSDDGAKEITIEVYDIINFYENAARKFEEQTGIKINVINDYSAAKDIHHQDYTQNDRISGELMAGKGADIYANINLDYSTIGGQGYLCNLEDWIAADPDFSNEKYYMNIWKAGFDGGDKYSVPLFMMFLALGSDIEIPELEGKNLNWEEFFEATKGINRNGALIAMFDSDIFLQIFNERYSRCIDEGNKTGILNTTDLAKLLKQCKEWSEQGLCVPISAENSNDIFNNAFIQVYCSGIEVLANVRFTDNSSGLSPYWYDIPTDSGIYDKANKLIPTNYICINAASPHKGTAWKFIKFLLSKEMQLTNISTPVNREAAADYIKNSLTSSMAGSAQEGKAEQVIKEAAAILDALRDTPNKYRLTRIEQILSKEYARYFNSEISAEEAASNMTEAVKLYIKEQ